MGLCTLHNCLVSCLLNYFFKRSLSYFIRKNRRVCSPSCFLIKVWEFWAGQPSHLISSKREDSKVGARIGSWTRESRDGIGWEENIFSGEQVKLNFPALISCCKVGRREILFNSKLIQLRKLDSPGFTFPLAGEGSRREKNFEKKVFQFYVIFFLILWFLNLHPFRI